ncbi:stress-related protein-like [Impatiens glandulifera]|uniref:stress-related protein-like n=1 Tax=Impatiens glandulifera TaxID=253017 RepID=UPI001FB199FE|nr:stress-related protein-like [Impatiens glandulifera]
MADSDPKIQLKYLQFLQAAILQAVTGFSRLYGYAKDNSGPLKPTLETVKTAIGPAYRKFHHLPIQVLQFVDRNIDESVKVSTQAVSEARSSVVSEVEKKKVKIVDTASGIANSVYAKYEPVAEQYAVSAWKSLNRLPLFPRVANGVMVPTAAYWSDKYNEKVMITAGKGYRIASYLPLVPTEKIARVFSTHRQVSAPAATN